VRVWVNFKELRGKLKFDDVLRHYGVEVKRKGEQHQGPCPLPNHKGRKDASSFSANLQRGIFKCFGCGAEGNQLEFAALLSGVDPADGEALRTVAVELQQKFFPSGASARKSSVSQEIAPVRPGPPVPVRVNVPLDFELKDLDAAHPCLSERGFARSTAEHFGFGFCSRGMLKDRLAIPLHDTEGKLLGYAGRVVDDSTVTVENPEYRYPSRRERNGTIFEFRKSLFLYNGFRFKMRDEPLIVVQDFPSVWWLTQYGFGRVVATMGAECSNEQVALILALVPSAGHIWVAPDGSKAGESYAQTLLTRLSPHRFVRWLKLEEGRKPTDVKIEELKARLSS